MQNAKYRGVSRGRRLTKSEADKYRKIRQQVEREIPPAAPDPVKVILAKLRAMRQAKSISLSKLAARTGMTRGNIARLESQKNSTLGTLQRYARGLDCDLQISVVPADSKGAARHKDAS
jgi:DNA-binding Xre family transcriptional regulator